LASLSSVMSATAYPRHGAISTAKHQRARRPTSLDDIGWKILSEIQQNARIPFAELGRIVGLSIPAVTERVHKMEEAGIIVGYRAHLDPAKVGLPILAFVNVKVGGENLSRFIKVAGTHPEVLECHRVTGAESFLLKVAVSDVADLETLLDALMPSVATTTSMECSGGQMELYVMRLPPSPLSGPLNVSQPI